MIFKLPPEGAELPTAHEDEIYDALMDELAREMDKNAADPQAEKRAMKRIAKQYTLTIKQLEALHLKVYIYRNGGS